jgi:charged multivesicular body protein 4
MFSFFGKKEVLVSPINTIQNMKLTIDMIEKREKFLELNIQKLKNEAKTILPVNKQKAITLLKKAKMNQNQLTSIYIQKENIELQIFSIEQSVTNKNILTSMKEGKNAIEQMSKNMDPDNIGELMDELTETFQTSNEVTDAISRPIGTLYDEDDLVQELELEVEHELTEKHIPQNTDSFSIPIKTSYVKAVNEEELAKLMLSMN